MMSQSRNKNGKSRTYPLRFKTLRQKNDAVAAAGKDGRSLNAFVLRLIDAAIAVAQPKK